MRTFALNHMTTPRLPTAELFALASELGCMGVELRNDLEIPLFDGASPERVRAMAEAHGVAILALAEVPAFDDGTERARNDLSALAALAARCGAHGVSLIPRNDGGAKAGSSEAMSALASALACAAPVLEQHGLVGYLEPLGFATASLRSKEVAAELIETGGHIGRVQLVHDTFHHHLSGETAFFAAHTGMVHISGVIRDAVSAEPLCDADRGLIDERDRLGNVEQLAALSAAGYAGPVSVEAFSPAAHDMVEPQVALREQFHTICSVCTASAA